MHIQMILLSEQMPGIHKIKWDGTNVKGSSLPDGIYISKLVIEDKEVLYNKMMFFR